MVSQSGEYALRAVMYLAQHGGAGPVRADAVAEALSVPRNYLGKVLHVLTRAGVLSSLRGPAGGFMLAVPQEELTLYQIVAPFDGLLQKRECLLGRSECSDLNPCSAHPHWKGVADQVTAFFRETTVALLLSGKDPAGRVPVPAGGAVPSATIPATAADRPAVAPRTDTTLDGGTHD